MAIDPSTPATLYAGTRGRGVFKTTVIPPGAPINATASAGDTQATISWTAPTNDGGSAITGYTVTASSGGGTCTVAIPPLTCTVMGVANGTPYTFTVVATNTLGDSPASAPSNSVTPFTVPDAPGSVGAVPGNGSATVSWTIPNANGSAITGYTVTASGGGACTAVVPNTSCTVNGLVNGTAYTFSVVATNGAGDGPAGTSGSMTPYTVPGAPTGVSGVAGNAQVTVSWTAPASNGGSAITGYTVTALGGAGGTCTVATTSCAVTGLTNGTAYTFTVKATNAAGDSAASAASTSVTPFTVPDAPTGVSGVAGNTQVTVSWTAPASTGGSAITGYTVIASGGAGGTCTAATTSCAVTGLTNGTAYTFTVKATNAAGDSAASAPSTSVTPATVPGAPTGLSGVAGNAQVTVSWTAPASTGGSAITAYTVTASNGFTCSTSTTSCVVTGLTNGTAYTFTVKATNAAGDSVASAASTSVTPFTVPGAPTGITATAGNGQATVSWTAPASNGGSTITLYTVTAILGAVVQASSMGLQAVPAGGTCTATPPATSCTVTGLTNNTPYTFTVVATNAAGDSEASVQSNSVTPRALDVQPVPTLSQWALALLALMLGGVAALRQRRA